MKITDEAAELIREVLTEAGADGLRLRTVRSCCSTSLQVEVVTLTEQDQPEEIGGLQVLMDRETRDWTGPMTIGAAGGRLTLHDPSNACC